MTQTSSMKLMRVLAGETLSPPPIWLMRQAGRYLPEYREIRAQQPDFINFCLNPEAAAEVTLQPIRRYGLDAAIVFADILLIPYGLGQKTWFEKGEGPKLDPISLDDLGALSVAKSRETLKPVMETLSQLRSDLPSETTLIGFCGAPWTVATYMIEGGGSKDRFKARALAWSDPQRFDALMDLLAEASAAYLADQVRAGADVVKIFDSWADGLPDPLFDRVVIRPTKRIIELLRADGIEAPVIGFPKGSGAQAIRYAEQTGITALAFDHGVDTGWASAAAPMDLPVQGQLDPAVLFAGGAAMDDEIDRLLCAWAGRPYVFNLGHGINLETPPDNVARLIERVRSKG